jgi:hypothetical protein
MIDIVSFKGETYRFDPDTERIFKGGRLLGSDEVEPVYSNTENNPVFSGIYLKNEAAILSRSGKINSVTNLDSIL